MVGYSEFFPANLPSLSLILKTSTIESQFLDRSCRVIFPQTCGGVTEDMLNMKLKWICDIGVAVIGPKNVDLILEYSKWILEKHPEAGLKVSVDVLSSLQFCLFIIVVVRLLDFEFGKDVNVVC